MNEHESDYHPVGLAVIVLIISRYNYIRMFVKNDKQNTRWRSFSHTSKDEADEIVNMPRKISHSMFIEMNRDFDPDAVLSNEIVKKRLDRAIKERTSDYLHFSESSDKIIKDSQENVKTKLRLIRNTTDIQLV